MNNGNLLSSLLGATGANSAAGKVASAKNRSDAGVNSSEKFRDALDQARPEIAAAKPAARRPSAETTAKVGPHQRGPDARAEGPKDTNAGGSHKTEKAPIGKKTAESQGAAKTSQSNLEDSEVNDVRLEDMAVADGKSESQIAESVDENVLVTDPASIVALLSPELLPGGDTENIVEMPQVGKVEGDTNNDEDGASLDEAIATAIDPLLVDSLAMPTSEADENLSSTPVITPPAPETGMDTDGGESQVANLFTAVPATAVRSDSSVATAGVPGAPTDPLASLVNQLGQDPVANDSADSIAKDAQAEVDAFDNPDFLVLSGKATFSKLMETGASADKTTPVIDPTKPALTATSVAEPLVRLSEAQSPATRSFVVQTGVPVTVGQPQWSQAVGEKVLWLAAQNVSSAEIRLDPPDLGTMHVKVTVNQDQASVSFTSPHPVVREALDQQLNRLREMFSEQGLNLVNVDVSDKSFAQQQESEKGRSGGSANDVEDDELMPIAASTIVSTRLVDHYA